VIICGSTSFLKLAFKTGDGNQKAEHHWFFDEEWRNYILIDVHVYQIRGKDEGVSRVVERQTGFPKRNYTVAWDWKYQG
jgi:hypothetical protein